VAIFFDSLLENVNGYPEEAVSEGESRSA